MAMMPMEEDTEIKMYYFSNTLHNVSYTAGNTYTLSLADLGIPSSVISSESKIKGFAERVIASYTVDSSGKLIIANNTIKYCCGKNSSGTDMVFQGIVFYIN